MMRFVSIAKCGRLVAVFDRSMNSFRVLICNGFWGFKEGLVHF